MRYEIRQMSFGEILDTGFQLLRNHFSLLLGLSLVLYAPIAVFNVILESLAPGSPTDPLLLLLTGLPLALAILVATPIVAGAITLAISRLYLGEPVDFGGALRATLPLMLPLMGTSLLSFICIAAGLALLILPGVYLMLAFILLWQVMVVERVFGTRALGRSFELMKGSKLRAFGVVVIGGIIVSVVSGGLQLVLGFLPVLGGVGSALAQAVGNVYTTAISVVLYFDIRCRKEAFDLEHLAQLVQRHRAAPAGLPLPP
jgi:hypothetical protein